ncbi:cache domain-containing protein [Desulfosarcina sp.]|uniref:cache domain-containing protein n=1 Tax=Desulfosarcina sp. TaxID=2027861 RepID=UPI0039708FDB
MTPLRFLENIQIRYKLLFSYLITFCVIIALGSMVIYSIVRNTIEANIESELKNATDAMLNMVQTAVTVSIKNHLRAVAEKNLEMVTHLYSLYQKRELTEVQARGLAESMLLSQRIGTTGYIACVSSGGVMVVHPESEWIDQDINRYGFVRQMREKRQGYIEYEWKNPGEAQARPKAMYMAYFEPWDWIIAVSSYRKEFRTLVNTDDFRDSVLSLQFSQSGYAFVTDSKGNVIIHPSLQGVNVIADKEFPDYPLETMLKERSGKITYSWKNPGEPYLREKLVLFNYLPEYEWIVASSSYLDEFYAPLNKVSNVIIFTVMGCILLVLPITALISASITNPLAELVKRLEQGANGDLSVRLDRHSGDEVGRLAWYFNSFMDRLEDYSGNLEAEVKERKEAEAALRLSENRYRSVIEAMPDAMVVYDMEGRVTYLNPAFTDVFGWTADECKGRKLDHFVPKENWEETRRGLNTITSGKPLSSVETRRLTKSGRIIDVSTRGAVYRDPGGHQVGSVIIHRDVSDLKRLERQVMDVGDRERQKIGQDLHDDLCPHLIGVEGLGKVLVRKLADKAPDEAHLAEKVTGLVKDAIIKTRRLSRGLCPVYLVDRGLESSLRELAANTESVFGVACRFICKAPARIRDNIVATHLFRIVQEAVNNAVRHGQATAITVTLGGENNHTRLSVEDDGCGIPTDVGTDGMGLRIMGFRANMIHAMLDIRSPEAGGTVVQVFLSDNAGAPVDP